MNYERGDIVIVPYQWKSYEKLKEEQEKQLTYKILKGDRLNRDGWKCLIVGEGDAYEELKHATHQLNMKDKVIFTGQQPYEEIPELIAAADICMLPANPTEPIMQEIVPIKLYEYMAMAKPVIATNLPDVRKEFGEDNGVVYVERPEDVVPKTIELIESGSLPELGQKARRFVEQNSWDKITDEFEALLEEVIREKKRKSYESLIYLAL